MEGRTVKYDLSEIQEFHLKAIKTKLKKMKRKEYISQYVRKLKNI